MTKFYILIDIRKEKNKKLKLLPIIISSQEFP